MTLTSRFHAALGCVGLYPPGKTYNRFRVGLCTDGQEETVREILKRYPDAVRWEKPGDMQPLAYALWQGQLGACDILIRHDPSILADGNSTGVTPLRQELASDNIANMEFLIARGADIHERGAQGGNLLHAAAQSVYTRGITILIQHGVDPRAKDDNGDTPLMLAAGSSPAAFAILKNHDPDLAQRDKEGRTLMMRAAMHNRGVSVIARLIDAGADLEEKSPAGKTALDYALDASKLSAVADLVSRGAVFALDDRRLATCLAYEEEYGDNSLRFAVDRREEAAAERERQRLMKEAADERLRAADEIARITEGTRGDIAVRPLRLKSGQ